MAGASNSMKEYLKRYQSGTDAEDPNKANKKKKKKKAEKPKSKAMGVLVVDEDPVWQKPVQIDEKEESDSAGEEQPLIEEDIEVKRMKRLEALRSKYNSISEDGSGWVTVSNSPPKNSPDLSPPRQRRRRLDTPSPEPSRSDTDLSPPRRKTRHDSADPDDLLPPRRKRSVDVAPSRRDSDMEPSRRDADLSPPRRKARHDSVDTDDLSPPRRKRSADVSPPRRKTRHNSVDTDDLSPPRRKRSADVAPSRRDADVELSRRDADLSPPRRKTTHDSVETADLSPPRRKIIADLAPSRRDADLSPPRKKTRHDSVETADMSPPRRKTRHDSVETADLSPPRRKTSAEVAPARKSRFETDESAELAPARREKEVARRSGFFTKEEIEEDIKKKKEQERARIMALDASISGKGAAPVYRDKRGKIISKEDLVKAEEQEKPKEEKPIAWGKGLAQKREAEAKLLELEKEKNKPFARSRDDPELDKMLKEAVRWGDPMAHLARKKNLEPILEDLGDDEKMKESGFIIPQNIPNHSWLKRGLDFPPNRYGIKPGRHWDGVDRSTGFEKDMFKRQNEKRATEQEAYLWSVSDM